MKTSTVKEKIFREMNYQICLLTGAEVVDAVNVGDVFDFPPDEKLDGFLTYAYIDEAAFTFEILAGARLNGTRVKIFPASYKKSVKLKRAQVDDAEIRILTAEYSLAFRDRIQMIIDRIDTDAGREQTRLIKTLDAFRHPHYPDDVIVHFLVAEGEQELLWVRCVSVKQDFLIGTLLNEPRRNCGLHEGDTIGFGVMQINEQKFLMYVTTVEGHPIA